MRGGTPLKKSKIISIAFTFFLLITVSYIFGCTISDKDEEPGCGAILLARIARSLNPEGYDRAEKELFGSYMEKRTGQSLEGWTLYEMQLLEAELDRLEKERR